MTLSARIKTTLNNHQKGFEMSSLTTVEHAFNNLETTMQDFFSLVAQSGTVEAFFYDFTVHDDSMHAFHADLYHKSAHEKMHISALEQDVIGVVQNFIQTVRHVAPAVLHSERLSVHIYAKKDAHNETPTEIFWSFKTPAEKARYKSFETTKAKFLTILTTIQDKHARAVSS